LLKKLGNFGFFLLARLVAQAATSLAMRIRLFAIRLSMRLVRRGHWLGEASGAYQQVEAAVSPFDLAAQRRQRRGLRDVRDKGRLCRYAACQNEKFLTS
jgi:hypothetical protein